jgi:hypothetical protein
MRSKSDDADFFDSSFVEEDADVSVGVDAATAVGDAVGLDFVVENKLSLSSSSTAVHWYHYNTLGVHHHQNKTRVCVCVREKKTEANRK